MDKRALLAIALSLAVLLLWEAFLAPKPPPRGTPPVVEETRGTVPPQGEADKLPDAGSAPDGKQAEAGTSAAPSGAAFASRRESPAGAPPVVVVTELARVEIQRVGGRTVSWTLKKYLDHEGKPYDLVSPDSNRIASYPFQFRLEDKALEGLLNDRASFDVERRFVVRASSTPVSAAALPSGAPYGAAPAERAAGPGEHGATPGEHVATPDRHDAIRGEHGATPDRHGATPGEHGTTPDRHGAAQGERAGASSVDSPDAAPTGVDGKGASALGGSASSASSDTQPGAAPRRVTATAKQDSAGGSEAEEVRLVFSDGHGLEAMKSFVFSKDSYLVEVSAEVKKNGRQVKGQIVWGPGIGTPSADDLANRYYDGGRAIADFGFGARRFPVHAVTRVQSLDDGLRWAGIEEQYFAAVFIPADGLPGAVIYPTAIPPPIPPPGTPAPPPKPGVNLLSRISVAVPIGQSYMLYAGPKDYQVLSSLDSGLTDLVNFAPSMPLIGPLVGVLAKILWGVLRWLHSYMPNYGIAIIILTAAIKIVFYPVTQRAMVKMRGEQKKMQKVQPKVNAIKEKYRKAKDASGRAKMNEEIMALYKREGINPMASLGGCLPLLLQLPILYGFYSVLTVSIELRQAPFFGWIHDLSRRDPYYITPIVMGVSMFLQQKMAMTTVSDPQQRMQQRMMLVMPIIFTYTFLNLPSGLVLYWFVNNILGIVQQVLINRQARAVEEAHGATATGKA